VFTDTRLKRGDAVDAISLGAISCCEFVEVNTIPEERDGMKALPSANKICKGFP
jgi:hypothetical protein